ncbi:MAG: ComEC/Rec2 family competence protein, partial [Bacteroidota bacterium]
LIQKTWQLLSVSLAAQLGVLPISLYYFHQFPALFFISNLLIIPFLGIILGVGILTMVLSLANLLPKVLVIGYNFMIKTMNSIIAWVAHQEGFVLKEIPMDGIQMILFYIMIVSLVLFLSKPRFKLALILSFGIMGFQLLNIAKEIQIKNQDAYLIPYSSKTSALLHKNHGQLISYASDSAAVTSIAANFKIKEQLKEIQHQSLGNVFDIEKEKIYRVDSFAIFPPNQNVDILWISQSPKINLERWLDSLQPKKIIADGTNYKSYVARWKASCMKRKLPFHYTREKGAYFFDVH